MENPSTGSLSITEQEFLDGLLADLEEINQSQSPDFTFGTIPVGVNLSNQIDTEASNTLKETIGERMDTQCATRPGVLSSNPSPTDADIEVNQTQYNAAIDSEHMEADLGLTWLDEIFNDHFQIVTWPTDILEDNVKEKLTPHSTDFNKGPFSLNVVKGENDPMRCDKISSSPPPKVEGVATYVNQVAIDFGIPSADLEIALWEDGLGKNLFESFEMTYYTREDAEKPPHPPLRTDQHKRLSPASAYECKEGSDLDCSLKIRDEQPNSGSSKADVKNPTREPLVDCTNLMDTKSHTNTGKPWRKSCSKGVLLKGQNTSSFKQKRKLLKPKNAPPMKSRHYSWQRPSHSSSASKSATHTQQQMMVTYSDGASTSASKLDWLVGILTRDPKVKSTEALNPDEKMQMMENVKQANTLLLTLVYHSGTTQLQSEEDFDHSVCGLLLLLMNDVDSSHERQSLSQNDLLLYHKLACCQTQTRQQIFTEDLLLMILSRDAATVCYGTKDLLSAALQSCRQHLSWKQVSGCLIQDPQVAGWLLDPEDPCTCFQKLLQKYKCKSLSPESPANVFSELYSLYYLNKKLCDKIWCQGLWKLYADFELKMIPILAAMESQCIQMDKDALDNMSDLLKTKMNQLEHDAHLAAGENFLLTSTIQIREILFEKLRLHERLIRKTLPWKIAIREDTASNKTLQMYRHLHPLPDIILEYRKVNQTRLNFVDSTYMYLMTKGYTSPNWSQTSVVTGKIVSSQPNFETIPRETLKVMLMPHVKGSEPDVKSINPRAIYIPEKDRTFVAAGFCQLEPRLLAHFSGDRELLRLVTDPEADVYAFLASEWMQKLLLEVTSADIEEAKHIVSSILYGTGREGLATTLGVKSVEARRFQEKFFLKFPKVKSFTVAIIQQCRAQGFVRSLLGHQRPVRHITCEDRTPRMQAEKQAIAFVLKGSMADLCKMAMIQIFEMLSTSDTLSARLIAQFNEELLFEVEDSQVEELAALVKRTMESLSHIDHLGVHINVPLKVAVSCGKSWGSMSALHMPPA
ncbi:DNA polymerase nu isoform X2 [Vanacampus margaritifer]